MKHIFVDKFHIHVWRNVTKEFEIVSRRWVVIPPKWYLNPTSQFNRWFLGTDAMRRRPDVILGHGPCPDSSPRRTSDRTTPVGGPTYVFRVTRTPTTTRIRIVSTRRATTAKGFLVHCDCHFAVRIPLCFPRRYSNEVRFSSFHKQLACCFCLSIFGTCFLPKEQCGCGFDLPLSVPSVVRLSFQHSIASFSNGKCD